MFIIISWGESPSEEDHLVLAEDGAVGGHRRPPPLDRFSISHVMLLGSRGRGQGGGSGAFLLSTACLVPEAGRGRRIDDLST